MAQPPPVSPRKAELISEIDATRARLSVNLHETLEDLNVVQHLKHSMVERKTAWITGAALTGGLLSWVFGPKKKKTAAPPPHHRSFSQELKQESYRGLLLGLLAFLFNLFKPLISTLASRKIAQLAARSDRP